MQPLYKLKNLGKEVYSGKEKITILKNICLEIFPGDSLAILGTSGSGKSTLLHILGTLDEPSWGEIFFKDKELFKFSIEEKAFFRNRSLGFVFQFHHLLPEFSVLENVALPGIIQGLSKRESFSLAKEALSLVGVENLSSQSVTTLSGGERQRVAIARAISLNPEVILADEPTGNLDEKNGQLVGNLLVELNQKLKTTLVVVTHNLELARLMNKHYELHAGELHALKI